MSKKMKGEGLLAVGEAKYEEIPLSDDLYWLTDRIGKFVAGGIYLVAGEPGIGKSILGIQIALDLGRRGDKTLFILNEQSKEDIKYRASQMTADWKSDVAKKAMGNVYPDDTVYDITHLPTFLTTNVIGKKGKYNGVKLIVIDSIQGFGISATATKQYRELYNFNRQCKNEGVTAILVAHVTKKGSIAGPKGLEHNVDCILYMRKAMIYRPLFVPKNRYGPAVLQPIPLEIDKKYVRLKLSPLSDSVSSVAKTYLGQRVGVAEAQAAVSLPSMGSRGQIIAPGLPKKEIEQLLNCISQIKDLAIGDLNYTIQCRLPGEKYFRSVIDFPLCMALISSYLQRDIPDFNYYIGEIDLLRKIRDVPEDLLIDFFVAVDSGEIKTPVNLFCPPENVEALLSTTKGVNVVGCETLDDAVFRTWPDLREGSQ